MLKTKKKIFITGICGFIGSHLAIDLYRKGYHVIGGDLATEPNQILLDYKNSLSLVEQEELEKYLEIFTIDFRNSGLYKQIEVFEDVDLIYHLASPIGVQNIIKNSGATLRASTKINAFIDTVCEAYNIPVVYSSSSEVFGSTTVTEDSIYSIKKMEDSSRWSYAAAKVHGEFLYNTAYYPSAVVRFFNVVGPGQVTKGMVVPTFVEAAINNKPLTILEDGIRSYCDIREAISYIVPIGIGLMNDRETSSYNKGEFNIGNADNILSVTQLAEKIIDIFDSKSTIQYDEDYKESDILRRRVLKMDNELLIDMDVDHYTIQEILENIKGDEDESNED